MVDQTYRFSIDEREREKKFSFFDSQTANHVGSNKIWIISVYVYDVRTGFFFDSDSFSEMIEIKSVSLNWIELKWIGWKFLNIFFLFLKLNQILYNQQNCQFNLLFVFLLFVWRHDHDWSSSSSNQKKTIQFWFWIGRKRIREIRTMQTQIEQTK